MYEKFAKSLDGAGGSCGKEPRTDVTLKEREGKKRGKEEQKRWKALSCVLKKY